MFTCVTGCLLTTLPYAILYVRGFDGFVASAVATTATGSNNNLRGAMPQVPYLRIHALARRPVKSQPQYLVTPLAYTQIPDEGTAVPRDCKRVPKANQRKPCTRPRDGVLANNTLTSLGTRGCAACVSATINSHVNGP